MRAMIYKTPKCCHNTVGIGSIIDIGGIIENELIEVECTLCTQVRKTKAKFFIYADSTSNEQYVVEQERVKILPDLNHDEEIVNQLIDLDVTKIDYINLDKL